MIASNIFDAYAYVFGRIFLFKFNKFLYTLGLRGMGILNYKYDYLVGEKIWLGKYLQGKVNPVVVDVGANIGGYSKAVFKANVNSNVIAFEPHPKTFIKLSENVKGKNFTAYNLGVGVDDAILELFDYLDNDGSSHASLYKDVIEGNHKRQSISHKVNVVKLDDFLKGINIKEVELLKIDTEGNELKVLQGIKELIYANKIKAIHFEFNEMNIISKASFKDFLELLPNYKLYRILPGGALVELKNYSPLFCEIYAFQNIVAILHDNLKNK